MTNRRRFLVSSAAVCGHWFPMRAGAQSAPPVQPLSTTEGAWALWDEVRDYLVNSYYEPLDPLVITRRCVDLLAAKLESASRLKPASYGTTADDCRRAFQEFILKLSALAGKSASFFVERAVEVLCEEHLKFSHYLPAATVSTLQQLGKAGLGMAVEVRDDGRFICVPETNSAAEQKGIRIGDELVSIDGVPVKGMNRFRLKPRLYGTDGSEARISVRQITGRILAVTLVRHIYSGAQVSQKPDPSGPRIRIPTFDSNTVADLRNLLKSVKEGDILTLDLRGNGGGDIQVAVDAAGLLIPGPRPLQIGVKKERGQPDVPLSTEQELVSAARRLVILQNEGTASASELLVGALQHAADLRVSVGGAKSYGKDLWQAGTLLKNGGGQCIISVGRLTFIDGSGWASGIPPTFTI